MEINEIFSIRCHFGRHEKGTCLSSMRMNAMKFLTHMTKSTREKVGFSCTNYLRPIVVLIFALATALNKFRFHSLRNKIINLVLVIKYHINVRLQFEINKKNAFSKILQKSYLMMIRATTWLNFLSSDHVGIIWVQ